jgi:endonuclease/exonuclease/phosphatase family metal-dependent hydrolase
MLFSLGQAPVPNSSAPAHTQTGITVVTLNMARETAVERILRDIRAVPAVAQADVLMLQEVKHENGQPQCTAEQLAKALGVHVAYSPAASGATDQGLAILSRYPLRDVRVEALKAYDLGFRSRARFALTATADAPGGPMHIINAHLDTRLNARERLEQLEPVVRAAVESQGRYIIGGDFNSNGFYWVGRVLPLPALRSQAASVRDFMSGHGFRTALASQSTFDYLGMQLDWIWCRGLQPSASRVYPIAFSDHHAVWSHVTF